MSVIEGLCLCVGLREREQIFRHNRLVLQSPQMVPKCDVREPLIMPLRPVRGLDKIWIPTPKSSVQ